MRFALAAVAATFALLMGVASALPQAPGSGGPAPTVCADGSGPYTKAGTTTAVCTPCASINRAPGTAGSGTCGSCNVANSALDSASGACLCGATDKGRIDNGATTGTTCAPCGVNGFSNGDRITCSPCIVGAAPRADTDGVTRCHCNTDKGYHQISLTSTVKKCVMCVSLGRKNFSTRSTAVYGEECGACVDPSKKPDATGLCVTPCAANSGYVNGTCKVCSSINRSATGDGITCGGCSVTNSSLDPASGACLCGGTDSGNINGACTPCGQAGFSNGDRINCSPCLVGASPDSNNVCHCNSDKGYYGGRCVMCSERGVQNGGSLNDGVGSYGERCSTTCLTEYYSPVGTTGTCALIPTSLQNGGFETTTSADTNIPDPWTLTRLRDLTGRTTGNPHSGSWVCRFGADTPNPVCQRFGPVSAGAHTLAFYLRTSDLTTPRRGSIVAYVNDRNGAILSTPELKEETSSTWTLFSYTVTVSSEGPITVCLSGASPPAYFYADDVTFV